MILILFSIFRHYFIHNSIHYSIHYFICSILKKHYILKIIKIFILDYILLYGLSNSQKIKGF